MGGVVLLLISNSADVTDGNSAAVDEKGSRIDVATVATLPRKSRLCSPGVAASARHATRGLTVFDLDPLIRDATGAKPNAPLYQETASNPRSVGDFIAGAVRSIRTPLGSLRLRTSYSSSSLLRGGLRHASHARTGCHLALIVLTPYGTTFT